MPNCPVCGRDIPSGTQYCPICGTNLQSYGKQTTQAPTYSPNYSYPQQGTGMPGTSQPHSHRKYVAAIVAALLIGLTLGFFIGYLQPVSVDYTTVSGTVSLGSYRGTPNLIMFNSTMFGNLSAAVSGNKYLINLPTGDVYAVSIKWANSTGTFTCIPTSNSFSSNNQNAAQDFSC
jgi:hypothetical protein